MNIRYAAGQSDAKQLASIHSSVLKNSFLTSLGDRFLLNLYQSLLKGKNSFTIVVLENKKIIGFATCTLKLNSVAIRTVLGTWKDILVLPVKQPALIPKLLQVLLYPSFRKKEQVPEIFFLAVIPRYQGKGIGIKLVRECAKEFKKRGYKKFVISVRNSMAGANDFYSKIGLKNEKTSQFLGEKINFWSGKSQ